MNKKKKKKKKKKRIEFNTLYSMMYEILKKEIVLLFI